MRAAEPGPTTMRPAVANSNATAVPFGENGSVYCPDARLRHHGLDRIPPVPIMCGFPVSRRPFRSQVDLNEDEATGIITLPNHIQPCHAGFLNAVRGILDARSFELLDELRLYMNVDV